MTDLEFIKHFSKITITKACKDCKVNVSNIWSGNASDKTIAKVKNYIEREVTSLIEECYGESEDNSL